VPGTHLVEGLLGDLGLLDFAPPRLRTEDVVVVDGAVPHRRPVLIPVWVAEDQLPALLDWRRACGRGDATDPITTPHQVAGKCSMVRQSMPQHTTWWRSRRRRDASKRPVAVAGGDVVIAHACAREQSAQEERF
jgi:hypothetical protein